MSKKNREVTDRKNKIAGIYFREFVAKTKNQTEYVRSVLENDITIVNGPAGTGKTLIAIGLACQYLIQGRIDNILYCRTIIGAGDELGFMPGDVHEKIHPYMISAIDYFYYFLNQKIDELIHNLVIKFYPLELMRGHTYNKSLMILDEASNATPKQIKLFLSRIGQDSKAIIIGDDKQSDINNNGLKFVCDKLIGINGVNIVKTDYSDILRNGIIGEILKKFEENGV